MGRSKHFLLWLVAILYLLFSPSLFYHFFSQEGKPDEVKSIPPREVGKIRFNIENISYWSDNMVVYQRSETYALGGWAFVDTDPLTKQSDFNRFVVIYNDSKAYLFPIQTYMRPDVESYFKNSSQRELIQSGFTAVISKNALATGNYKIGLLFEHKKGNASYYIEADRVLVRKPNRLYLEPVSK